MCVCLCMGVCVYMNIPRKGYIGVWYFDSWVSSVLGSLVQR